MILNAVICVWNEEDIIESTVKHAFAQGCANVFIVDNASIDKTVQNAVNAGAKLVTRFDSKYWNEFEKIAYLNTIVRNYNQQRDEDYIWWLYLDADEFPNIDHDLTILDFLKQLDPSVRAVHGYMFNHIPTHPPYHLQGYHPADFQPICVKSDTTKISLLRYDKNKPHLYSGGGAHTFDTCGEIISMAENILDIHHFQYRKQNDTLKRLKLLAGKNSDGTSRIDWFDKKAKHDNKSLTAQSSYHNRYNNSKTIYIENIYKSMIATISHSHKYICRWYNPLEIAISDCSEQDRLLCLGIHYFFLEKYDLALFKFNDLLEISNNNKKLQLLITIKIAECLSFTNKKSSLSLIKPILKYHDTEIRGYAEKQFNLISEDKPLHEEENIIKNIVNYYAEFKNKTFI